ncbi:hypothetical protein [Flavobacterium sp.]|uniref:hypothetical protein n=1 Tax=Flavobacterium sp. TaxID=239 RepID=UPI002B4B8D90|nr:hypothetical protein [Flavobacterium sp.]HLF51521.1 hypothetical protein [Flavobacterium sp.]
MKTCYSCYFYKVCSVPFVVKNAVTNAVVDIELNTASWQKVFEAIGDSCREYRKKSNGE